VVTLRFASVAWGGTSHMFAKAANTFSDTQSEERRQPNSRSPRQRPSTNHTGTAPTPSTCVPTTTPSAAKRSTRARCVVPPSCLYRSQPAISNFHNEPRNHRTQRCDADRAGKRIWDTG
jgi:hypothetical protein